MSGAADATLRRAPAYPGAPFELSELTFTVEPRVSDPRGETLVQEIRRARRAGVTTFDIAGASDPPLAEALLARAFPGGEPEVVLLTRPAPRSGPWAPAASPRSPWARAGAQVREPARPPSFHRLPELRPEEQALATGAAARRCETLEDLPGEDGSADPRLFAGRFSLLEAGLARAAARSVGESRLRWIAHDVFASGRLDGTKFSAGLDRAPAASLRSVRELEADFAPVSRLGFLARPGERTLAQAALWFVLGHPWVATAVLPLPTSDRWREVLEYRRSPPLSETELSRLESPRRELPSGQPSLDP
jgi:aryl-alcohol dehydrogenase-like predicted oxidoreductase